MGRPQVDTRATSGVPATVLAHEARGSRMLLLGRHGAGGFSELLLGSTSTSAAAHASTTVVVVPADWSADRSGTVVVGVGPNGAGPVLEQALAEADRRGVPLRAVHAWDIHPELSWDAALAYGDLHEFEGGVRSRISEAIRPWTAKYPAVDFELQVRRAHPTNALKAASAEAVLLVVGAHHRTFASHHQRLGSVARGVLHHATVPVMVVRRAAYLCADSGDGAERDVGRCAAAPCLLNCVALGAPPAALAAASPSRHECRGGPVSLGLGRRTLIPKREPCGWSEGRPHVTGTY